MLLYLIPVYNIQTLIICIVFVNIYLYVCKYVHRPSEIHKLIMLYLGKGRILSFFIIVYCFKDFSHWGTYNFRGSPFLGKFILLSWEGGCTLLQNRYKPSRIYEDLHCKGEPYRSSRLFFPLSLMQIIMSLEARNKPKTYITKIN